MNLLDAQPSKHPRTASRLVEGEAVVVLPEEGTVKVLNPVGSRIWELTDGMHTVQEIARAIYGEYDVDYEQAERDVTAFVEDMVQNDLMTVEAAT